MTKQSRECVDVEFETAAADGMRLRGTRCASPIAVQSCVDVFLADDIAAYAATCRMLGRADPHAGLSSMNVPIGVIVGEEDHATPLPMAEEMQRRIRNASLRVIERALHLTPVGTPDAVTAELIQQRT